MDSETVDRSIVEFLFVQITSLLHREGVQNPAQLASLEELWRQSHIQAKYDRWWLECVLPLFVQYDLYDTEAQTPTNTARRLEREQVADAWQDLIRRSQADERFSAPLKLVDICLCAIQDILLGKTNAVDVLFPNGSLDLVHSLYEGTEQTNVLNRIVTGGLRNTLLELNAMMGSKDEICITEVGAGVGGTAAFLLPMISELHSRAEFNCRINYRFTDISNAFLTTAKKRFAEFDFVSYEVLDVTDGAACRDVAADIIVATNVLHATTDVRTTLNNLKAMLPLHGLLFILESVEITPLASVTFGLLDGWWAFTDVEHRLAGSPLLSMHSWLGCLHTCGFEAVVLPGKAAAYGHAVFAASSDGCIKDTLAGPRPTSNADASLDNVAQSGIDVSHDTAHPPVRAVMEKLTQLVANCLSWTRQTAIQQKRLPTMAWIRYWGCATSEKLIASFKLNVMPRNSMTIPISSLLLSMSAVSRTHGRCRAVILRLMGFPMVKMRSNQAASQSR